MARNKSQCFRKHFLAVVIPHYDVIRAMEGDQVFVLRTDVPINFPAITRRNYMIVNGGHDQSRRGNTWQFFP